MELKETDIITTVETGNAPLRKMRMFHIPTRLEVSCDVNSRVKYNLYDCRIHLRNELAKLIKDQEAKPHA